MASVHIFGSPDLVGNIHRAALPGIARDAFIRGRRVERVAKARLAASPRRIASGALLRSITTEPMRVAGGATGARVGSGLYYALWVHEGTGLFGPNHTPIVPKRRKFMRFIPEGSAEAVFARSVKGMPPNPFLRDAMGAALL